MPMWLLKKVCVNQVINKINDPPRLSGSQAVAATLAFREPTFRVLVRHSQQGKIHNIIKQLIHSYINKTKS